LELGPGTGSVTLPIIKELQPGDHLTICEINPRFMRSLQETLNGHEHFHRVRDQVSFFLGAAQDLPSDKVYDIIVCALPFVNFDLPTVRAIFNKLREISSPETLMTYYEYMGVRKFNETVGAPERRDRVAQVHEYLSDSGYISYLGRERVWLNVLPVNVYTVKPAA
jgi:phospholipid N-methyltransferase